MSYHFRRGLGLTDDQSYTDEWGVLHVDDRLLTGPLVAVAGVDTRSVQPTGDQHPTQPGNPITYAPPALKPTVHNPDGSVSCDYDVNPDRSVNKVGGGVWPGVTVLPPKCCPTDNGNWVGQSTYAPNALAVPGSRPVLYWGRAMLDGQGQNAARMNPDGSYVYDHYFGDCDGLAVPTIPPIRNAVDSAIVTSSNAASGAPGGSSSGKTAPPPGLTDMLKRSSFGGIPNWALAAGALAAAFAFSGGGNGR